MKNFLNKFVENFKVALYKEASKSSKLQGELDTIRNAYSNTQHKISEIYTETPKIIQTLPQTMKCNNFISEKKYTEKYMRWIPKNHLVSQVINDFLKLTYIETHLVPHTLRDLFENNLENTFLINEQLKQKLGEFKKEYFSQKNTSNIILEDVRNAVVSDINIKNGVRNIQATCEISVAVIEKLQNVKFSKENLNFMCTLEFQKKNDKWKATNFSCNKL